MRIGSLSLKKQSGENDYPVAKTIIHPKYSAPKSYHDLAIIKVRGKMKFTDNIKPICLADGDDKYVGRMAKVIGWGAEEVGEYQCFVINASGFHWLPDGKHLTVESSLANLWTVWPLRPRWLRKLWISAKVSVRKKREFDESKSGLW